MTKATLLQNDHSMLTRANNVKSKPKDYFSHGEPYIVNQALSEPEW